MDAQQPITETNTCQYIRTNGEFCKRSVTEGEDKCWQHASSWSHRMKSLTRNQTLGFVLVLVGLLLGVPSLYFSYASWRDGHLTLTVPKPPSQVSGVVHLPVSVVPDTQAFVSDFVHDNYIFKISNDTDIDLYQAQIMFKIADSMVSFRDFSIEIPASSRKPIIDGSPFLDISGVRGSDANGHSILLLSIHRLTPHEVREISFTRNKLVSATVTAAYAYSTDEPQPRLGEPNQMREIYHPLDNSITLDSSLTFLANGSAKPKSVTTRIQKNKEEPLTTTTPTLGKPAPQVKLPTPSEPPPVMHPGNTPPAILKYDDAKKRLDSNPDQLTLHDLYLTDFQTGEVRHERTLTITGPEPSIVKVESTVIWQVETGTEFVLYYIPPERETSEICMYLSGYYEQLLTWAHQLGADVKAPGESEQVSSKGLVFSNRIFIYHETYLSPEQIIQVRDTYKAKGVTVLLRSADYLSNRKLEAKVKKLEKDRN
jgi:hypothetical protein